MTISFTTVASCPSLFFHSKNRLAPTFARSLLHFSRVSLSFSFSSYKSGIFSPLCQAAKQQSGSTNKRRKKKRSSGETLSLVEIGSSSDSESQLQPSSIPKPPAGFILDPHGKVLAVSSKRIATIVDSKSNSPLECTIRRVFKSSKGDDCMLLCPIDTPIQILKSSNFDGWVAVSDEEVEAVIPTAAYALAKIHMHLVHSGFCYTARGVFCYSEGNILEFQTDDGESIDGLPAEGIEITCFHQEGSHFLIYTPSDPLLFVAVKDENGLLKIADDELLDDPAIISVIDEETEFNALVEEEHALLESLLEEE